MRKLGFGENVRFLGVAICRATPSITEKLGAATTANIEAANNPLFRISEPDPMMVNNTINLFILSVKLAENCSVTIFQNYNLT